MHFFRNAPKSKMFIFGDGGLISKNYHVINFKTEKELKVELFDFWAFQNFMQMLSHDKIIFHMLFGAFHVTSRTISNGWIQTLFL